MFVGVHVTISASAQPILMNCTFWPRLAYARPWVVKDQKGFGAILNKQRASTAGV